MASPSPTRSGAGPPQLAAPDADRARGARELGGDDCRLWKSEIHTGWSEAHNRGDASLYGPFPWVQAGYTRREEYSYANLGPNYVYNPTQAKKLLTAAGYPNGFEMTLEWAEFRGSAFSDFAVAVAKFFEDIGVRTTMKQVDISTWSAMRWGARPFTDALIACSPPGSGPSFMDWVYFPHHSTSPPTVNTPYIADAHLDELLNAWRLALAEQQLAMQQQIWDSLREQVDRLTTIVPPHYRLTQSYVHAGGVPYCWFIGFCSYEGKTAWLTDKAPSRKFEKCAQ